MTAVGNWTQVLSWGSPKREPLPWASCHGVPCLGISSPTLFQPSPPMEVRRCAHLKPILSSGLYSGQRIPEFPAQMVQPTQGSVWTPSLVWPLKDKSSCWYMHSYIQRVGKNDCLQGLKMDLNGWAGKSHTCRVPQDAGQTRGWKENQGKSGPGTKGPGTRVWLSTCSIFWHKTLRSLALQVVLRAYLPR